MLTVPHFRTVIGFCLIALVGYGLCSLWVINYSADAGVRGDVIGTWKSMAVAAFSFWVGASSGGKARDVAGPTKVEVQNTVDNPVPVTEGTV